MRRPAVSLLATLAVAIAAGACGDDGPEEDANEGAPAVANAGCGTLEFGGEERPEALITSDLPMRGDSAERSRQQVEAIRLVLERAGWRAGETSIGFQACDDTARDTGLWDAKTCVGNARAYAREERLLAVIGTYNSGCAQAMLPVLNRAGVPLVSPGNTAICLTQRTSGCEAGTPGSLYERGPRNYVRVVPNDAFQGAALAQYARDRGYRRVTVLHAAEDATSIGQAASFRGTAARAGVRVSGDRAWDPEADDYRSLMRAARRDDPDAVVLAGLTDQNGGRLIRDKSAVLGDNERVPLLAFDGFAQQSTLTDGGDAARGMVASVPGRVPERLEGEGRAFAADLRKRLGTKAVETFAPYAGEAADLVLDAIAAAGRRPTRAATLRAIFAARRDGLLGAYRFTREGDPSVGPVTILLAGARFTPTGVVEPRAALVRAARSGG